jgi:hypothetical protein
MAHITSMELTNSSKLVTECYLDAAVPAFGMLVIAVMTVGSGPELTLRRQTVPWVADNDRFGTS